MDNSNIVTNLKTVEKRKVFANFRNMNCKNLFSNNVDSNEFFINGSQIVDNEKNAKLNDTNVKSLQINNVNVENLFVPYSFLLDIMIANNMKNFTKITNIIKCDFKGKNLANAVFSGMDLTNVDFTGSDLSNANFANSNLTGVNFTGAKLRDTKFINVDISTTIFENVDIDNALFLGTNLGNIDFSKYTIKPHQFIDCSGNNNFPVDFVQAIVKIGKSLYTSTYFSNGSIAYFEETFVSIRNNFEYSISIFTQNSSHLDDNVWGLMHIGFPFKFGNEEYTMVSVSTNGLIMFGEYSFNSGNLLENLNVFPTICAYWDDLSLRRIGNHIVRKNVGDNFILEFKLNQSVVSGSTENTQNFSEIWFQVILQKKTNKIYLKYRNSLGAEQTSGTIGLFFSPTDYICYNPNKNMFEKNVFYSNVPADQFDKPISIEYTPF